MTTRKSFPVIELDGKSLAIFYEDMKSAFAWFGMGYNAVNKWADRNGNGILSPLGAQALKYFIKATMDGTSPWKPHWDPLSKEQIAFKEDRNAFTSPWKMEGNIYRNIVIRKVGSAWTVGIDRRVTVPKIGFRTNANIRGPVQRIKVETYAAMIEFGHSSENANIPERPLFFPAFAQFKAGTVPELLDLVKKSMSNAANLYRVTPYSSSKSTGDTGTIMSQASVDYSKGMEPNKDFSDGQFDEMQRSEMRISSSLGNMASDAKRQESAVKKQDQADLDAFNKKHNIDYGTMDPELQKILKQFGYK